ncbi:hypothetical protein niasHT_036980 [Heterodera trifolii]|uniref:Uncharacterized protein n=1 Tax=Heterodera trifolii TaxID=157864 RepID=A0ABD2ID25_9BILA
MNWMSFVVACGRSKLRSGKKAENIFVGIWRNERESAAIDRPRGVHLEEKPPPPAAQAKAIAQIGLEHLLFRSLMFLLVGTIE